MFMLLRAGVVPSILIPHRICMYCFANITEFITEKCDDSLGWLKDDWSGFTFISFCSEVSEEENFSNPITLTHLPLAQHSRFILGYNSD